jgi:hypothetical protein
LQDSTFDFLTRPLAGTIPAAVGEIAARLFAALILGVCIAWIYRVTRGGNDTPPTFPGTLVLLAVLIAMVTQVIGDKTRAHSASSARFPS